MNLLSKSDYENLLAMMEEKTRVFTAQARASAMLCAKLTACIQQLDDQRRDPENQGDQDNKDT
ncbi:hypothetical protein LCGC14_0470670 [marine sediment metagenome]|uniref:Uncharacterized protein n=1 Tax=marine sediment metagenome TaxID=412755 RepID=A0A0F9VL53_9ZZZZ